MQQNKRRLLILGAGGLLGCELINNPCLKNWEIIGHARQQTVVPNADLSNEQDTFAMLDAVRPHTILNLVGVTDVDRCEKYPNEAYLGNVKSLETVVRWIKNCENKVHLVHISTDQVYDGIGPHSEENVTLTNYYAFSKYAGELIAGSINAAILRTNFFGKSHCGKRSSITDWLFNSLNSGKQIQVFDDVMFSPLSMNSLSRMIAIVLEQEITGLYNLGARGGMSKADFAFQFAHQLNLPTSLMTRTTTGKVDFLKTYRPKDMRLNVDKFENALGLVLPELTDEINKVTLEYRNET